MNKTTKDLQEDFVTYDGEGYLRVDLIEGYYWKISRFFSWIPKRRNMN